MECDTDGLAAKDLDAKGINIDGLTDRIMFVLTLTKGMWTRMLVLSDQDIGLIIGLATKGEFHKGQKCKQ